MPDTTKQIRDVALSELLNKEDVAGFASLREQADRTDAQKEMNDLLRPLSKLAQAFIEQADTNLVKDAQAKVDETARKTVASIEGALETQAKGLTKTFKAEAKAIEQRVSTQVQKSLETALPQMQAQLAQLVNETTKRTVADAMPEAVESARMTDDEIADMEDRVRLSIESQVPGLILEYLLEQKIDVSRVTGLKEAIEAALPEIDPSKFEIDYSQLRNVPPHQGGGSRITIQENGQTIAKGNLTINFGAGVTATESNGVITVTGSGGGGGGNTPIQETPAGTIDGSNATFTLSHTPVSGTLVVYLNGQFVHPDDYPNTGTSLVFDAPLDSSFNGLPFTAIYEYA